MRSFVALPCPERLRGVIARARREWRFLETDIRWTDPARVHVTLRFLGDATPDRIAALDERLARTAARFGPVALEATRTGAFPDWERARVLWLGLADAGPLAALAGAVEKDARSVGFEPEERPFRAHLTLGRVKGGRGIGRAIEAVRAWSPSTPAEEVSEVVLYRSDLGPEGPRYSALGRYPLEGGS